MAEAKWYETWFNTQEYLDLYKHRDIKDAVKVLRIVFNNIRLQKNAKVLDLACGNGRHSLLFAKKGFNTLGVDLSPFLIRQARKHTAALKAELRSRLRFEISDMRKLNHKDEFDLVVNLFSSFGYFGKDNENETVINSIAGSLKKGGYFFFDFLNSGKLEKNLVPFSIERRNNKTVVQLRYIRNGMSYKDILIFSPDVNVHRNGYKHYSERVRMYGLGDFRKMFSRNSLKIMKVFGDYDEGRFYKSKSERLIIIARKL